MAIEIAMMSAMAVLERRLEENFTVHRIWEQKDREAYLREVGGGVRGAVTYTGAGPFGPPLFDLLPKLEIIANFGMGYESIDLGAAKARRVIVTNAGGVISIDVAEHTMGMILDVARNISAGDRFVRAGEWLKQRRGLTHRVSGRKLGIVGLGNIGMAVAKCAEGFDMPISYHNRHKRPDVPYRYVDTLVALAAEVDFLVVATTGGPATRHLVGRPALDALGPEGVIVNIARGTVIDQTALVEALVEGRLGGAGLDVFDGEPAVPEALFALNNVVLQPHQSGATYEGVTAASDMVIANLKAYFAGRPVLTPVG